MRRRLQKRCGTCIMRTATHRARTCSCWVVCWARSNYCKRVVIFATMAAKTPTHSWGCHTTEHAKGFIINCFFPTCHLAIPEDHLSWAVAELCFNSFGSFLGWSSNNFVGQRKALGGDSLTRFALSFCLFLVSPWNRREEKTSAREINLTSTPIIHGAFLFLKQDADLKTCKLGLQLRIRRCEGNRMSIQTHR